MNQTDSDQKEKLDDNFATIPEETPDQTHQNFTKRKTRRAYTDWELLYGADCNSDILTRVSPTVSPPKTAEPFTDVRHKFRPRVKSVHFQSTVTQFDPSESDLKPSMDRPPNSTNKEESNGGFFKPLRLLHSLSEIKNRLRHKDARDAD